MPMAAGSDRSPAFVAMMSNLEKHMEKDSERCLSGDRYGTLW